MWKLPAGFVASDSIEAGEGEGASGAEHAAIRLLAALSALPFIESIRQHQASMQQDLVLIETWLLNKALAAGVDHLFFTGGGMHRIAPMRHDDLFRIAVEDDGQLLARGSVVPR